MTARAKPRGESLGRQQGRRSCRGTPGKFFGALVHCSTWARLLPGTILGCMELSRGGPAALNGPVAPCAQVGSVSICCSQATVQP